MKEVQLFEKYTGNLIDYTNNIVYSMRNYVHQLHEYVPSILANDSDLKSFSENDIDLLSFLLNEGETMIKNQSVKLIDDTIMYLQRKKGYFKAIVEKTEEEYFYAPSVYFMNTKIKQSSICCDIEKFQKMTKDEVEQAYCFDDIPEEIILDESYDIFCHEKSVLENNLDEAFDASIISLKYLSSMTVLSDTSIKSCMYVKELIDILVNIYYLIGTIYIYKK